VEFDVRFSIEGEAVIVHDETLDRIFHVPRRVRDLSAKELADIGVPTLSEVLAALPVATLIDLELKEQPSDALFATVIAARGAAAEGIVLSSFQPAVLHRVKEFAPTWPRWLNAETVEEAEQAAALGCVGLSVAHDLLNDVRVRNWYEAGLEIAAWTIRDVQGAAWTRDPRMTALCVEGEGVTAARAAMR